MKILVISLAGVGDTLLATPAIKRLKELYPDSSLEVLVLWNSSRNILKDNPYINHIYWLGLSSVSFWSLIKNSLRVFVFLLRLRRNKYDISINTYPQSKTIYRIFAYIIGAKKRLSHIYDKENVLDRILINFKVKQEYSLHTVENNDNLINILDNAGKSNTLPKIFFTDPDISYADQYVNGIGEGEILGIHIGSGTTKNMYLKRWPMHRYIELVDRVMAERKNVKIVLFSGLDEKKDTLEIKRYFDNRGFLNRIYISDSKNIKENSAVVSRCKYFLSVDSALMHIASAVGVERQVIIETPTINMTNIPLTPYTLVKNVFFSNQDSKYYSYNGGYIKGGDIFIKKAMESVKAEEVYNKIFQE